MGLLDLITGGKKPQRRGPTGAEARLGTTLDALDVERQGLVDIFNRGADRLAAGRPGERSDALGRAGADVAQRFAGGPNTVDAAVQRGAALSRAQAATDNRVTFQNLRDRAAFARRIAQRRGTGLAARQAAANVEEGIAGAQFQTGEIRRGLRENALGSLAGVGLNMLTQEGGPIDRFRARRSSGGLEPVDVPVIPRRQPVIDGTGIINVNAGERLG